MQLSRVNAASHHLAQPGQVSLYFARTALNLKHNRAVWLVPDPPRHGKVARQPTGRRPEANPLDPTLISCTTSHRE